MGVGVEGAVTTSAAPDHNDVQYAEEGLVITSVEPRADKCVIDTELMDHECTRNYDGRSDAMESDGLIHLIFHIRNGVSTQHIVQSV